MKGLPLLLELIENKQKRYFFKTSIYKFKDNFFYLFEYNSFYYIAGYTVTVQLYVIVNIIIIRTKVLALNNNTLETNLHQHFWPYQKFLLLLHILQ